MRKRAQNVRSNASLMRVRALMRALCVQKHLAEKREMTNGGTRNAGFTKSSQTKNVRVLLMALLIFRMVKMAYCKIANSLP